MFLNLMFDLLLESSHRDDSNKRSNIGFGHEIMELPSIEVNFTHVIWSSAVLLSVQVLANLQNEPKMCKAVSEDASVTTATKLLKPIVNHAILKYS